jgi:hypothetical protein
MFCFAAVLFVKIPDEVVSWCGLLELGGLSWAASVGPTARALVRGIYSSSRNITNAMRCLIAGILRVVDNN